MSDRQRGIGLDFAGTIAFVSPDVTPELCLKQLHGELEAKGIHLSFDAFMSSYMSLMAKHRELLLPQKKELNNETCVAEVLGSFGYDLQPTDPAIAAAMDACFRPYIKSTIIPTETISIIKQLKDQAKIGLVSNFSYPKVIHLILDKFRLAPCFDSIIISGDVGWRKPHTKIFNLLLHQFSMKAQEVVFVGDTIEFDVVGAKRVGMTAVLITEGEDPFRDTADSPELAEPDFIIDSFSKLPAVLRNK